MMKHNIKLMSESTRFGISLTLGVGLLFFSNQTFGKKRSRIDKCNADLSLRTELLNAMNQNDPINNGNFPPDPINAVGSNTVITMVNLSMAIWVKDTLQQSYIANLINFFPFESDFMSDPWIMYDEFSKRFFVTITTLNNIYLAVSKKPDPRIGDDFFFYKYHLPEIGLIGADYPKLACDREAVYITWRDPFFVDDELRIFYSAATFDKKSLVDGTSPVDILSTFYKRIDSGPPNDIGFAEFIFPVQPHVNLNCDKNSIEKVLLVQARTEETGMMPNTTKGNTLRIYQVKNVLDAERAEIVFTDVKVPEFMTGGFGFFGTSTVPQPPPLININNEPIIGLETAGGYLITGTIRDKSLWTSHDVFSEDGQFRKLARWYEIDISKFLSRNKASLVQSGDVDPGNRAQTGLWQAINVDKHGNMGISFALAGELQYPALAYTGRLKSDPKGTVRLPLEIPISPNLYYQELDGERNRYGDYSGLVVDPEDGKTFWMFHEYPYPVNPEDQGFGSLWTTYLAAFQISKGGNSYNAPQGIVKSIVDRLPVVEDEDA